MATSAPAVEYGWLLRRFVHSVFQAVSGIRGPRSALSTLVFLSGFVPLQALHWAGFLLDEVLFRGYRDVDIREPVFIVGMPRTGTSFLQQVLSEDEGRFTTVRLWEVVLAPSVTERMIVRALIRVDGKIGRPFGRLIRRLESVLFRRMDSVHPVRLNNPEEDYLFLLPVFACFLLVLPFPHHPRIWELTRFDELPERDRNAIMGFFRSCVQRHLYVEGGNTRLLSKNPSFTPMLRSLDTAFPGARFICCLRDPEESVPSLLNSMQSGAEYFGWDMRDSSHTARFTGMLEYFASHSIETLKGIDPDRYAFVPLRSLKHDVRQAVIRVYARFGWTPDAWFLESLAVSTESGRKFRSRHVYALADFGLTREGIRRRFAKLLEVLAAEAGADSRDSAGVRR